MRAIPVDGTYNRMSFVGQKPGPVTDSEKNKDRFRCFTIGSESGGGAKRKRRQARYA